MRKTLRKSDVRELNEGIKSFGIILSKKDNVEVLDDEIIFVNDEAHFFYYESKIAPTLKLLLKKPEVLKKITVDMGAVKFVTSGADIMRPGIVDIDEGIEKDELVAIVDEKNRKPLAVGQALDDADPLQKMTSGKAVRNVHFVGDKVWNS